MGSNPDSHFALPIDSFNPIAQITMLIVVVCSALAGISRRMGNLVLGLVSFLLMQSFSGPPDNKPDFRQSQILAQIPTTVETILKKFNLEGKTTTYAVCPQCHHTYAPKFNAGSRQAIYPKECTNRSSPSSTSTCNTKLFQTNLDYDGQQTLLKTYVYNEFHDYVASLLSRKDLEDSIDSACDEAMASISNGNSPSAIENIFQADFVREFKGPDEEKLFIDRTAQEARLIFVFNVDFFSAEGQTIHGATASCGLVSAACLNLPVELRYKSENMYVAGVIPGPTNPSGLALNHYIRPLIDDLLVSWERGVYYSRTANYPQGRTARSAACVWANDLPAARHVSQCASSTSHHYCSRCSCYGLSTLGRTDITSPDWIPKNAGALRQLAEAWRAAPTEHERSRIFTESGMRWSELWRLPYWDPSRMLAVDAMHCLLEGLAQFHFRTVLGLTEVGVAATAAKAALPFKFTFPLPTPEYIALHFTKGQDDLKEVVTIHKALLKSIGKFGDNIADDIVSLNTLAMQLAKKKKTVLAFVMQSLGIRYSSEMDKNACGRALSRWVSVILSLEILFSV